MSASAHRGRRPGKGGPIRDIGIAPSQAEAQTDPRVPTRLDWWRSKIVTAAGFPPPQSGYQRIFPGQGRYVPQGVWRDGRFDFDTSQPNMPFGFVQVGYRYSFPIADLGVAQGHKTLCVLPACIASNAFGGSDRLSDIYGSAEHYHTYAPGGGRLKRFPEHCR